MDYALIMTEGTDEKAFLEVLLEKGMLKYARSELFYEKIFHARQINGALEALVSGLPPEGKVLVYRVGDKLSDRLRIPSSLSSRIKEVVDISTTPEFEVLLILEEGEYQNYLKEKSKKKPSEYYKELHPDYRKGSEWVKGYFEELDQKEIKELLERYQRLRGSLLPKGRKSLLDLVR